MAALTVLSSDSPQQYSGWAEAWSDAAWMPSPIVTGTTTDYTYPHDGLPASACVRQPGASGYWYTGQSVRAASPATLYASATAWVWDLDAIAAGLAGLGLAMPTLIRAYVDISAYSQRDLSGSGPALELVAITDAGQVEDPSGWSWPPDAAFSPSALSIRYSDGLVVSGGGVSETISGGGLSSIAGLGSGAFDVSDAVVIGSRAAPDAGSLTWAGDIGSYAWPESTSTVGGVVPPSAVLGGSLIGVAVVDAATRAHTSAGVSVELGAFAQWSGLSFCLVLGGGVAPPLRQVQRDDGLARGARRATRSRTSRQGSLRHRSYL